MANINKNAVVLEALKFARERLETAEEVNSFFDSIAKLYENNQATPVDDVKVSEKSDSSKTTK